MKPKVTKKYLGLLVQNSMQRVLEVLFRYPEQEFSLSDIAKEAEVAKPHTGPILANLEQLGFITIVKLSKIWRIKANQQSGNFLKSKIVYNLNFIYQCGLVEFLIEHIETDETEEYKTIGLRILSDFEKEIGRKIQLHSFNRKNVDVHVFNNIANGIVLSGFLEVKT